MSDQLLGTYCFKWCVRNEYKYETFNRDILSSMCYNLNILNNRISNKHYK